MHTGTKGSHAPEGWSNVKYPQCYNFSLSNLSTYLISSYLSASLIYSHEISTYRTTFDPCSPRLPARLTHVYHDSYSDSEPRST